MLPRHVLAGIVALFLFQNAHFARQQLLVLLILWRFQLLVTQTLPEHELNRNVRRRRRRMHPYRTLPRPVESWFEIHFRRRAIAEEFFRQKMGRYSLLRLVNPYVLREDTRFRRCIPPEKVLAVSVYRLVHGGSMLTRVLQ